MFHKRWQNGFAVYPASTRWLDYSQITVAYGTSLISRP